MSSMCSMPTESRTVSGVTPAAESSSSFSCECVVEALWIASDFASPMFARWLNSSRLSMKRLPASRPPSMPNVTSAAVPAAEDAVRDLVRRVRLEARVVDPRDALVPLEVPGDGERVRRVPLHPQRQRLEALQEEERVERRHRRAGVPQQHRPDAADVRRRAERVAPDDAVVGRVRLRQAREAVGVARSSRSSPSRRRRRRSRCRGRRCTSSPSGRRCRRRGRRRGSGSASGRCCRRRAAARRRAPRRPRRGCRRRSASGCRSSRRRRAASCRRRAARPPTGRRGRRTAPRSRTAAACARTGCRCRRRASRREMMLSPARVTFSTE